MSNVIEAIILDIQRMSTEDGPGIRTTVFFKGCNLSCQWCHNPESISFKRDIQWFGSRCIGCRSCIGACNSNALSMSEKGISIDRSKCKSCLSCVNACPANAMEAKGEKWDVEKLVYEVLKDRTYFEKSGGGVTLSGGEALLQCDFTVEFLKKLKQKGIHTAVDTAGAVPSAILDRAIPYTDLLLYDIKLMDPGLHKKYTGQRNETILENAVHVAESMRKTGNPKTLWIRTPVIPGATSDEGNIEAIGKFIADNMRDVVERWELCSFNNLCRDKYKRLDMDWPFKDTQLMSRDEMEHLAEVARRSCLKPDMVVWSGATRVDRLQ